MAKPWKWPEGSFELALLNLASFGAALAAVAIWRATPIATKIRGRGHRAAHGRTCCAPARPPARSA